MTRPVSKLLLLLILSVFTLSAYAAVSEYSFASTTGTYTEITGGTIHGTSANDNECFLAIPIGFTFTFNGVAYNNISIATNGFIAMGDNVISSNVAISAPTSTNNIAAALNRDIKSRDNGSLMTLTSGAAPNRVFTVQWTHYRRIPTATANDDFSFQIQLLENGNKVQYVYGPFTAVTATTAAAIQVGLRGNSNADFNNRATTTDWSATTAGTTNNSSCTLSAAVFPANGLTFTFSPATTGEPPMPAQNPNPANNAINVPIGTNLGWTQGGGITDGYKVYLGTNNPPTNIVNGTTQTATSYNPAADFTYNTIYYWQIVPFNANGDALNCPVWSFTTLADPTVTAYPYNQNFDAAIPPALPVGWTSLNANNDVNEWETYAGIAESAPNSIRIKYNDAMAMNDWLIAPPLVFTAPFSYKVKFYYRAHSATLSEKLSLYYGNAPTPTGMNNLLWQNLNITNVTYEMVEVTIPVTTTGTYYIGFHGNSDEDRFYLYVDTFSVTELTEELEPPTNLAATVSGNDVHLAWTAPAGPPPQGFNDGFESYDNFAITFAPWTLVDVDQSATYGMTGTTWTNGYAPQAYIIFNPSATTPALTDLTCHTGDKMAACFAATAPPNNDWMITPQIAISAGDELSFWARSYTAQWGLERFKIGVSTTGTAPANFTIISGANYIQAPVDWTEYTYSLAAYAGQNVYIGFQCLSNDAFIYLVDDVHVGPVTSRADYPYVAVNHDVMPRNVGTPVFADPSDMQSVNPDRALLGYKIYRDGALINTIQGGTNVSYDDNDLAIGTYSYTVTAYYDGGESVPAGPVTANIIPVLDPPVNLTATVADTNVHLDWDTPGTVVSQWIHYDSGDNDDSIGTGSAADFDVAIRYPASALTPFVGTSLYAVKVWPAQAGTFSARVWTGGTPTVPGTRIVDQPFTPTLDVYNTVVLNTPVPITGTEELWFGYRCNVTGGYPAGCDAGPAINGFGNMMYFQGAWQTLLAINPALNYNWNIQGWVGFAPPAIAPVITIPAFATNYTSAAREVSNGTLASRGIHKLQGTISRHVEADYAAGTYTRNLLGYKVYRDGTLISTITGPANTAYDDNALAFGTYSYTVTANYDEGESVAAGPVQATIVPPLAPAFFTDSFEDYADFALTFAPWTLLDQDQSVTYGFENVSFPNSESPMAFIIFNPSTTTPPMTSLQVHTGAKMAASMPPTSGTNNDYLVSPRVHLGTNSAVKFWARTYAAQAGLAHFRVGVSLNPNVIIQGWQYVSGPDFVEAPNNWTEFTYDLSTYDNQNVYIAIRCVSTEASMFNVDDFSIHSNGGSDGEDPLAPVAVTELKGNYPNPFNPETTISYSVKENLPVNVEIYNLKGQKVKTLVNENKAAGNYSVVWNGTDDNNRPVSSGVYFFKMNAGKYSSTKKMIMMK